MSNKQFMTLSEAELFMKENAQFFYEFTSCKTELGEEPAYVYVDNAWWWVTSPVVKYLVIRDEINHPSIYAFDVWSDGVKFFTSDFYEGQKALDFITENHSLGLVGTLKMFRDYDEAMAEYEKY